MPLVPLSTNDCQRLAAMLRTTKPVEGGSHGHLVEWAHRLAEEFSAASMPSIEVRVGHDCKAANENGERLLTVVQTLLRSRFGVRRQTIRQALKESGLVDLRMVDDGRML